MPSRERKRLVTTGVVVIGCFMRDLKASFSSDATPAICHPDTGWPAVARGLWAPLQALGYTLGFRLSGTTGRTPKVKLQPVCLFARRSKLGLRDVCIFHRRQPSSRDFDWLFSAA